jgi:two-component system KDP operon response regulator KdpE
MSDAGPLVLIIDDEAPMRRFLRVALVAQGYRTVEAGGVAEGLRRAVEHNPDLLLLDLGLPDGDGLELTRQLREWSKAPIIVISARGQEADKVRVLDCGADDYLTKPFSMGELMARIRVALRHAARWSPRSEPVITFGEVQIDLSARTVSRGGRALRLTPHEYKLLTTLAGHAGKVLTHRQLLLAVWGPGHVEQTHYLRVYMAQLRQKIEDEPARPRWLVTELGVGYRLRGDGDAP